jgi:ribonuclease Z
MSTFMRWETIENMEIYGGHWALERIRDLLFGVVLRGARPPMEIEFKEIKAGVIFEEQDFNITAFPVSHRGSDCFGYLFEEYSRRPFLPEKAEILNVPPGPWRRDLVNGKTVSLPDGRRIEPDQVLGPARPGTKLVHVGDAGRTESLADVCQDADLLVIEATYLETEAELARDFAHLTAAQASRLALENGVSNLILTHLSRRYRERDVITEAQAIFPEAIVARDFDAYQVRRKELVKISLQDR